jgi:hypothetical protein
MSLCIWLWTQNVFLFFVAPPLGMGGYMFISPLAITQSPNTYLCDACVAAMFKHILSYCCHFVNTCKLQFAIMAICQKKHPHVTSSLHKILTTYVMSYMSYVTTLATKNTWKKNPCFVFFGQFNVECTLECLLNIVT